MNGIYISIGLQVIAVILYVAILTIYRHIYNKKIFFSLTAMEIFHNEVLKISNKFYRWVFWKNVILSYIVIISLPIIATGNMASILALTINSNIKYIWLILCLVSVVILNIVFTIIFSFPKFWSQQKSYKYINSSEYGEKNFFEDDILDKEEYDEFSKKLDEKFLLDFINQKDKIIKTYNLNEIQKICFKKGKFSANELNYLLFVNPKFILLNKENLDFKTLSYLRRLMIL
ncbi:hypothetical protein PUW89_03460 [Metamycoplasma hyosynoviae]|uniref:hypothetical protein n=1 Tax=Metamycoplasma hyosynoviae TaxID=29559 RepID=UPI0023659A97|nr:hypothetical protein [Metamycoplasma hyosynoviae]MDD7847886.1 hypothetical protein [Metamycoplasma hyosynoviae]